MIDDRNIFCCGCRICVLSCPVSAISLVLNEKGDWVPSVSKTKCIHCSLCEKVCPEILRDLRKPQKVFLCFDKNKASRKNGSSGNAFGVIAKYLLSKGWQVAGAAWSGLRVEHRLISTIQELPLLQKSKYIQSNASVVFPQIRQVIFSGGKVFFVGTPCQVSALKNYLGPRYNESLLCADFLCHGVPPQRLFDLCIECEERRKKIRILSFSFRAKERKNPHSFSYLYSKSKRIFKKTGFSCEFPYYSLFLSYKFFMNACYHCPFSQEERAGDLTFGDGWGGEAISRSFATEGRNKGCSELFVVSEKGDLIFREVQNNLRFQEIPFSFVNKTNKSFVSPVDVKTKANIALCSLPKSEFDSFISKNYSPNRKEIFKECLWWLLPRCFRNLIDKLKRRC